MIKMYVFMISPLCYIPRPFHLHFVILIIFSKQYKLSTMFQMNIVHQYFCAISRFFNRHDKVSAQLHIK
jgi:hypothetical protein